MTELQKAQEALDKLQKEKDELQKIVEDLKAKEKEEKKLPDTLEELLKLSEGKYFVDLTYNDKIYVSQREDKALSKTGKIARNVFLYAQLKNIEYVVNEHFDSFIDPLKPLNELYVVFYDRTHKKISHNFHAANTLCPFYFGEYEARNYFLEICEPLILEYYQTL